MKELKIMQIPDHISAVRKNGKFLHIQPGNTAGPLFMQEVTKDDVGSYCTLFKISEFDYSDGKLTLRALISFPETCKQISLQGKLFNEDTKEDIYILEEKTVKDSTDLSYEFENVPVSANAECEHPAVILYADWIDSAGTEGEAALIEDELPYKIVYDHYYPKKESNYVAFSSGSGIPDWGKKLAEENREAEGREEEPNIVISLFRMPTDTKDLDYACLFKKLKGVSDPQLSIPARGVMTIGDSEVVFDKTQSVVAKCYIASPGNGGMIAVAVGDNSSYETADNDIILEVSDKSLGYNMLGPWSATFTDPGQFINHPFDFVLDITCNIIPAKSTEALQYTFFVSSKDEHSAGEDYCLDTIPKITIKWGCLARGTKIRMSNGRNKAIEDIQIGDHVRTVDGTAEVTNMWSGEEEECLLIRADNRRKLILTKDHPVQTEKGWKRAGELTCLDVLKTRTGTAAILKIERVSTPFTVYNPETGGKPIYANGFLAGDYTLQNSDLEKE